MNSEPPTQLSPVCPFHTRQLNKLAPLVHDRHLAPRHGSPPWPSNPCHDDVSVMSPNTCRRCLRAVHLSRPSTSCFLRREVVDARVKPGHDAGGNVRLALGLLAVFIFSASGASADPPRRV